MKTLIYNLLIIIILSLILPVSGQDNCLVFDGTQDYVTLPNTLYSANLQGGTELTIEYWFKGTQLYSPVRFQDGGGYIVAGWSDPPQFIISTDGLTNGVEIGTGVEDGNWHHIACVWKSNTTNGFQTYVDGVVKNQRSSANVTLPAISSGAWLGTLNGGELISGTLDEVRIWKTARTQTEIRQNMHRELPDPSSETNLVAYYKFNETSGTSLADSKNNYTGTLTNMAGNEWSTSSAMYGPKKALDFDGSGDYVSCNLSSSSSSVISIESMVSFNNLSGQQNFIHIDDGAAINRIVPYKDDSNNINLFIADASGNADVLSSSFMVEQNQWYHMAFIYNNKEATIYINGLNVASKTMNYSYYLDGTDQLYLGSGAGSFLSNIKMDEVRIWNTARTQNDICENMYKNLSGNETGLIAYYSFDHSSGNSLADFSGQNNNGTLTIDMTDDDWVSSTAFNTWLNTSSTDWNTATNWSLGSVPVSSDNVGIYHTATISNTDDIECTNLIAGENATLEYHSHNHIIHGSVINIGTTNLKAGSQTTITRSLYVLPGSKVNIEENAALTINHNNIEEYGIFGEGEVNILSTAAGTGSLIIKGNATGNIKVQRYLSAGKWHYISAPVNISGNFASLNMDLYGGAGNDQFYRWEEDGLLNSSKGIWVDILNGPNGDNSLMSSEGFTICKGYAINSSAADKILNLSGAPILTDQSINATYTPDGTNIGANLLGNPFCSSIAITESAQATNNFLADNDGILDENYQAVYIWYENGTYTKGQNFYQVICNSGFSGQGSLSALDQDFVAPGQAFMVKVKNSGSIKFDSDTRKHGSAGFYKNSVTWPGVELTATGENIANSTIITFHEGMTKGLDPSYDAAKLRGNPEIALYSRLLNDNGHDFAVQALPETSQENAVIPLGLDLSKNQEITFSIYQLGLENTNIILEDRQTGSLTDMHKSTYTTPVNESSTGRFFLHFGNTSALHQTLEEPIINIWCRGNEILFGENTEAERITLTDLAGRTLGAWKDTKRIPAPKTPGIYLIILETKTNPITKKITIK